MRQRQIAGVTIELTVGDITAQPDVDAVVNAANAALLPGGGVAGAIHRAAGPGLARECAAHAPIQPGQCVITTGHRLSNPHVIHCLGPVYGLDEPAVGLLASCYHAALDIADRRGLNSIAFPAISTGAFGYPMHAAADIALSAIAAVAPQLASITRIRLVLFDQTAWDVHAEALARVDHNG